MALAMIVASFARRTHDIDRSSAARLVAVDAL
jgi:hypothetical protein